MRSRRRSWWAGTSNLLAYPEYADIEKARMFLSVLESREKLYPLLRQSGAVEFTIRIGPENDLPELSDCSLVTAVYRIGNNSTGTLGILGPTRMNYGRVISVLEFMGKALSSLLPGEGLMGWGWRKSMRTGSEDMAEEKELVQNQGAAEEPVQPVNPPDTEAESQIKALREALEKAEGERDDYLRIAQRTQADFMNYKRLNVSAKTDAYDDGVRDALGALLPTLDNLERALDAAKKAGETGALTEGRRDDDEADVLRDGEAGPCRDPRAGRELRPRVPQRGGLLPRRRVLAWFRRSSRRATAPGVATSGAPWSRSPSSKV